MNDVFLCIVVAWILALLARFARQPLILAYLGAGMLVGPVGMGWIESQQSIGTIAELGLVFLLFMIGLEIDLKKVLSAGRTILTTALIQILGGVVLGLLGLYLAGFARGAGRLDGLYLAVTAALSSTVIIVKILDVTSKVTTLRDFFLTLFFVALGMAIPPPEWRLLGWALLYCGCLIASRVLTVFLPLHWMGMGHRVSLLPALNLCQVSEFSLVILALGYTSQHLGDTVRGVVSYAFVILAVNSSYTMVNSEAILRWLSPRLRRLGLRDLDARGEGASAEPGPAAKKIYFLGFFWTASSLLEEIHRRAPDLLADLVVVDFNPESIRELRRRGVQVIYGDISERATLLHAGVGLAEAIVCTIPNALLKGTSQVRLVQQLRKTTAFTRKNVW